MNNNIPQVKTVKLMFVAMDEQQQAMFKMAFKCIAPQITK